METQTISIHKAKQPQTRTIRNNEDEDFLLVPVVMMVEGVHNGSHGLVLHTAEGLQTSAPDWADIPVTIAHPQKDGQFISANQSETPPVGIITNPVFAAGKLKGMLKLDRQKLLAQSPEALEAITTNKELQVSIGAYTDERAVEGEWNGEKYIAVAESYTPDHLALLPGQEGACSWADGCGIRVNAKPSINQKPNENEMISKEQLLTIQANGLTVTPVIYAENLTERISLVSRAVDGMDNEFTYHYLEAVYDAHFVVMRGAKGSSNSQPTLLKQSYTIADGVVQLVGEPVKVTKTVTYKEIQTNVEQNQKEEMDKPCTKAVVTKLVANGVFTEEDRAGLEQLELTTLEKMMPEPPPSAEEVIGTYKAGLTTAEDFLNLMPEKMAAEFKAGLEIQANQKTQRVEKILAQSKDAFTKEELTAMDGEMLTKIEKMLQVPATYQIPGGNGGQPPVESEVEPLIH